MSDPQEAATPSDPHSAEALAAYPSIGRNAVLGDDVYLCRTAFDAGRVSRDAEVAELKAKIADAWDEGAAALYGDGWEEFRDGNPHRSASSPVEGGN